jgi:hypothetical protein
MNSILLIDDKASVLDELEGGLRKLLGAKEAEIRRWSPSKDVGDARVAFGKLVDHETVLVITDQDLTGTGATGLFGSSIVAWCQGLAIPVGDYSRALDTKLPKEPNLFEVRVPPDSARASKFIAAIFRGFAAIREQLAARKELLTKRSPAGAIADLLGVPSFESQFALYGVRLGATSAALVERFIGTAAPDKEPSEQDKQAVLSYIVGHLLLNAVLRFPGPIASATELSGYLGVSSDEMEAVSKLLGAAIYTGPFQEIGPYYWVAKVDEQLRPMIDALDEAEGKTETHGELHRNALEKRLGRKLKRYDCPRCHGQNGGYWCPFTSHAVCQRPDCSVGANSWIPQGARMCRIERGFYDEWAPILGI